MKLIMPMAGDGSRFAANGYTLPKPLIDVNGKPMFVHAVESIDLTFDHMIFIVRKEHDIKEVILEQYSNSSVIEIENLTEGAACTVLLADKFVDDNDSVFISNCDQIIEWNPQDFIKKMNNDGIILTFSCPEQDSKWSFAQVENECVLRVAEKDPISSIATTGHYYWKRWDTFKNSAHVMIEKNDRFNGEFYLCPTYNYAINDGKIITIQLVDKMYGIGTPEDLTVFFKQEFD